jgi:hypothetical protein
MLLHGASGAGIFLRPQKVRGYDKSQSKNESKSTYRL